MNNRNMLLTIFLLIAFLLHTVTSLGFANHPNAPAQQELTPYEKYEAAKNNLNSKYTDYDLVHKEFDKVNAHLTEVGNSISEAEAKVLGSALLTAAGVLSGLGATAALTKTAATIASLKNAAETLKNISTLGSKQALKDLQQSAFDLETEVIDRVIDVKTQAEKVNTKLQEWAESLPDGEVPIYDDEEVVPIDVEAKYASLPQTHKLEPPLGEKGTTETTTCRGCGDVVTRSYLETTLITPSLYNDPDNVITETIFQDHGIKCPEKRYSMKGKACDGVYYSCPSPYPGTATVCRHTSDHLKNNCGHDYPEGNPEDHGQRVVCGATRGVSRINASGNRVQDTCQGEVWACSPHRHSDHSYTEAAYSASLESGVTYVCANPTCELLGSSASGSGSSAHHPVGGGSDAYQRALSARAWGALHWNHCVALGISAAPEGAAAPKLSYEHQCVCRGGHEYWICDTQENERHGPRTCSRTGSVPGEGSWKCRESFSHCTNGPHACWGGWHSKCGLFGVPTLDAVNTDAFSDPTTPSITPLLSPDLDVATFVSKDALRSTAVIKQKTTGRHAVLSIGGVIGDFTLMKIQPKQVTLDHHGKKPIELHLPEPVFLNPKRR